MEEKQVLLIPGPTPVPPSLLLSGARPMVNHRGPEFAKLIGECTEALKQVFQTRHDVFILTGSGTGGLEAAVVNLLSPGDQVLSVSIGVFGDRFAQIAEAFGAAVEKLDFEMGQAADPARIRERLSADTDRQIKAVLVTQNETSTGVMNDLAAIAPLVRAHGALCVVDGISSLLAMDCQMDAWGIDVVIAGSQKAFMIPPGLCFAAVNDRAWAAMAKAKMPRFYWDFGKAKQYLATGQTPWTPALPQIWQLGDALKRILQEGLPGCFARHARLARMTRAGVQALDLKLLADPAHASPAVTAVWGPEGLPTSDLRRRLRDRFGVVLAGGQGKIRDQIFRIGHIGWVNETDLLAALSALGAVLAEAGLAVAPGAGVSAAARAAGE